MSGFIAMNRDALDHHILRDAERFRAWFWLVSNACWKPAKIRIKGQTVELKRGELSFSVRFLADAWGWSKSRVARFLSDLTEESMIETRSKIGTVSGRKSGQGQSIITICNYDKYQDPKSRAWDNGDAVSGTTAGQQRDKEEQGNKETNKQRGGFSLPEWVPSEEWAGYLEMRKAIKKPMTDRAKMLAVTNLQELNIKGHKPKDVLNQSVLNNWQGLFAPKVDSEEARKYGDVW